tara:strand:- start:497 stop:2251 length:1755 start_codon:yes stop_codon:yes gene_type:complete
MNTSNPSKQTKEEIISQALKLHSEGNISEAKKYYEKFIAKGFNNHIVFSNYGVILQGLGKLKEAEISLLKAIKVRPQFEIAHFNLGGILKDLGKLKEAELSLRKAIELKPNYAEAYNNLGTTFKDLGKSKEAEISLLKAIQIKPDYAEAYYNLGGILKDLGKLKEAELSLRKAIEIKPNYAEAYNNLANTLKDLRKSREAKISICKAIRLKNGFSEAYYNHGMILKDLGKLKEAELSLRKAIELKPNYAMAYYSLSTLEYSNDAKTWQDKLFSKSFLNNKSKKEKVDIYFARANVSHKKKDYKESSKYLLLANNLKLALNPSQSNFSINKSKSLLIESYKKTIPQKEHQESPESIFILGMPRSGSTLLESILSMNANVNPLGEINILEESFIECKKNNENLSLPELYWKKTNSHSIKSRITTNKYLYNYQYAGIIASQIPNAKIIHCFRNPLDNILSIYRAHFYKGNNYSSSLVDCARVYIDQEEIMSKYKNRFRSNIYDLNYDSLAINPNLEIKSIISWLGWEWDDSYLSHHLNQKSVYTASNVQVRSEINSKSIGGWKNYKEMLQPAIDLITSTDKYQHLIT